MELHTHATGFPPQEKLIKSSLSLLFGCLYCVNLCCVLYLFSCLPNVCSLSLHLPQPLLLLLKGERCTSVCIGLFTLYLDLFLILSVTNHRVR